MSPPAQSHFLFSQVVVQDGYDSDAGVDHKVATNLEGPQETDEIDIPQVGDDGTASNGVDEAQAVIILSTSPLLSFPNSKLVN